MDLARDPCAFLLAGRFKVARERTELLLELSPLDRDSRDVARPRDEP